jgi:hypothetical protein
VLGVVPGARIRLTALAADPDRVPIGGTVTFTLTVELDDAEAAEAVIDYRVHYVGANGQRQPKVFKLTRRRLQPGRPTTITPRHRFEHVSIRRIHPGRHSIDVQVNGHVLGAVDVDVFAATTTKR